MLLGRRVGLAALTAMLLGACDYIEPSDATPTSPTSGTTVPATAAAETTAMTFEPGATVPDAPDQAVGCLDDPGTLHAPASAWYHTGANGVLSLSGQFVTSDRFVHFTSTVDEAVQKHTDSFVADAASELAADQEACVSYRSVQFSRSDGSALIVAVWRAEGAADPYWIPNETGFTVRDESTLISDGAHIRVALVVGPDGTTVRVTAYGKGELEAVSGWPTTSAPPPTVEFGPAPATVDEIVAIGHEVLSETLQR
jgi:hypothetical protein